MADASLLLLIGPVGAGKSTYARRRAASEPAVFLDADEWQVRLFGADPRPEQDVLAWYLERRERSRALLWDTAVKVLRSGSDVILELGLVTADERRRYYEKARGDQLSLDVCFVDAPRDLRRERVRERNETGGSSTQIVPLEFFERASDMWEEPSELERVTWGVRDA